MSLDTADEIHHAEDTIGVLTAALDEAVELLEGVMVGKHYIGLTLPERTASIRFAAQTGHSYCRPTCEYEDGEWLCGEFCGCPADHEPKGHAA